MYVYERRKKSNPGLQQNKVNMCCVPIHSSIRSSVHRSIDQCCFFQNLVTIHWAPKPNFFILSLLLLPLDFLTRKK
jgi:hypothetical protein